VVSASRRVGPSPTRWIGEQTNRPSGPFGWLAAVVMMVGGQAQCHHRQVAGLLRLRPDDRLLDVGCGSGLFLRRYCAGVGSIAGVDHSAVQIALARRVLGPRLAEGTAAVVLGDAAALPWPDQTFTAVACNSLMCIVNTEPAVREMHRVLRPGGRIVVAADHHESAGAASADERRWGWRAWTDADLRGLLATAGFGEIVLDHEPGSTFATAVKPTAPTVMGLLEDAS
jgi:SAM-dependent methyltransferase